MMPCQHDVFYSSNSQLIHILSPDTLTHGHNAALVWEASFSQDCLFFTEVMGYVTGWRPMTPKNNLIGAVMR